MPWYGAATTSSTASPNRSTRNFVAVSRSTAGPFISPLRAGGGASSCRRVELDLAQSQVGRGDFHALVVRDELERLLEGHGARRNQSHELVCRCCPMVRELLLLGGIHVDVTWTRVLAHDHSLVYLDSGPDDELATLLQVHEGVRTRDATAVGDEAAGGPRTKLAVPRLVAVEHVVQQPCAAGFAEE